MGLYRGMARGLTRDPDETGICLPFGGVSRSVTEEKKGNGENPLTCGPRLSVKQGGRREGACCGRALGR